MESWSRWQLHTVRIDMINLNYIETFAAGGQNMYFKSLLIVIDGFLKIYRRRVLQYRQNMVYKGTMEKGAYPHAQYYRLAFFKKQCKI